MPVLVPVRAPVLLVQRTLKLDNPSVYHLRVSIRAAPVNKLRYLYCW